MSINFYRAIDKAVGATSANTLCDALRQCKGVLESRFVNKAAFMEKLQGAMKGRAIYYKYFIPPAVMQEQALPNTFIYEDNLSYLIYSSFIINSCTGVEELKGQISGIIDFFENKMTHPRTDLLKQYEIIDMLTIVQKKYSLLDAVTQDRELEIFILNRSHLCYDSFLLTFKNNRTGRWVNKWMVFSLSPCMDIPACNKYFVFLHELGHILFNAITNAGEEIPPFFRELTTILGLPYWGDKDKLSELFADVFAACTMNETRYSEYNPFKKVLPDKITGLFEVYFKMLSAQAGNQIYSSGEEQWIVH